jgi:hypothetical protein
MRQQTKPADDVDHRGVGREHVGNELVTPH